MHFIWKHLQRIFVSMACMHFDWFSKCIYFFLSLRVLYWYLLFARMQIKRWWCRMNVLSRGIGLLRFWIGIYYSYWKELLMFFNLLHNFPIIKIIIMKNNGYSCKFCQYFSSALNLHYGRIPSGQIQWTQQNNVGPKSRPEGEWKSSKRNDLFYYLWIFVETSAFSAIWITIVKVVE